MDEITRGLGIGNELQLKGVILKKSESSSENVDYLITIAGSFSQIYYLSLGVVNSLIDSILLDLGACM